MLLTLLYIVGFLRTLFFIVVAYYLIRWLGKILIKQTKTTNNSSTQQKKREGETTIKYNKKGEKIVDKDKGEYTDFEEVE